jgi:hypothetical protein
MKDAFQLLQLELDSVELWLDSYMKLPLPTGQRRLAVSLKKYIAHCRRDKSKWRSESAANHARLKVKDAWIALYAKQAEGL